MLDADDEEIEGFYRTVEVVISKIRNKEILLLMEAEWSGILD